MVVHTENITISTRGDCDILDVTDKVAHVVRESGLRRGMAHVCVVGATAAVTTVEYEPGLIEDLQRLFEQIAPVGAYYAHDSAWHDGNGHAHVRASLVGPNISVPVVDGALVLGTWQQIIIIDFDNRPRTRPFVVQVMGE